MFGNIVVLIIVLALTVGGGWFPIKAVRTPKMWVKIVGGLLGGVLTLVLAALTFFVF